MAPICSRPPAHLHRLPLVVLALALLALIAPSAALAARAAWSAQRSGTARSLAGSSFADRSHGFAVGNVGTILATRNGGATWRRQVSGTTANLNAVATAGAKDAWAVGRGVILATTDGGASWVVQDSALGTDLMGVSFADSLHGWAVGGVGGARHGWADGGGGSILATTDGGATWTAQYSLPSGKLYAVASTDDQHAWAVGFDGANGGVGAILATTDGGATWTAQDSKAITPLYGVSFANDSDGWVVGMDGEILATQDGGAHWVKQPTSVANPLYGVSFRDKSHGLAVGATDTVAGIVLRTNDGGATWTWEDSRHSGDLFGVSFVDARHAWAVGRQGRSWPLTDGRPSSRSLTARRQYAPAGERLSPRAATVSHPHAGRAERPQQARILPHHRRRGVARLANIGRRPISAPPPVAMSYLERPEGRGTRTQTREGP